MLLREPLVRMLHGCRKPGHAALSSKDCEPKRGTGKTVVKSKGGLILSDLTAKYRFLKVCPSGELWFCGF